MKYLSSFNELTKIDRHLMPIMKKSSQDSDIGTYLEDEDIS